MFSKSKIEYLMKVYNFNFLEKDVAVVSGQVELKGSLESHKGLSTSLGC